MAVLGERLTSFTMMLREVSSTFKKNYLAIFKASRRERTVSFIAAIVRLERRRESGAADINFKYVV